MTDITKFKSIAVKIDPYRKAKTIADENYMSVGAFVNYLIDKEHNEYQLRLKKLNLKEEPKTDFTNGISMSNTTNRIGEPLLSRKLG